VSFGPYLLKKAVLYLNGSCIFVDSSSLNTMEVMAWEWHRSRRKGCRGGCTPQIFCFLEKNVSDMENFVWQFNCFLVLMG